MNPTGDADFTLTSSRLARVVADDVGLSTAATDTLLTAITMHHTPGVTADAGPVAYLLAAGAAVDVVGLRSWDLPPPRSPRRCATIPVTVSRPRSPRRSGKRRPASPRAGPGCCFTTAPSRPPSGSPRSPQ